jgi:hypothetical protein
MTRDPLEGDVIALMGERTAFRRCVGGWRILFALSLIDRLIEVRSLSAARRPPTAKDSQFPQ